MQELHFGYMAVVHCFYKWSQDENSVDHEQLAFGPYQTRAHAIEVATWECEKRMSRYDGVYFRIRQIKHRPDEFWEGEPVA